MKQILLTDLYPLKIIRRLPSSVPKLDDIDFATFYSDHFNRFASSNPYSRIKRVKALPRLTSARREARARASDV